MEERAMILLESLSAHVRLELRDTCAILTMMIAIQGPAFMAVPVWIELESLNVNVRRAT